MWVSGVVPGKNFRRQEQFSLVKKICVNKHSHTVRNRQNSNFEAGDLDYFEIVYQFIMFLLLMLKSTEASFPRITLLPF